MLLEHPDFTPILRWNSTGITVAGITGQYGNASNQLYFPFGLYLDWSNTLYIADRNNHRIQKYLSGSSSGETVAGQASGVSGNGSSFLDNPRYVSVDINNNLYVSDTNNHRIQQWNFGSTYGTTIAGTGIISYKYFIQISIDVSVGTAGNSSNQLNFPLANARSPLNNGIYITDTDNDRIMYYSDGIVSGTLVAGGNGKGVNNNQLYFPSGLYVDMISNSLIIMNRDANNIVRWTLGASNWTLIAGDLNGLASNTSDGFSTPRYFAMDPMGNMYIADCGNHRIQFYSVGQTSGLTIAGTTGVRGNNTALLNSPLGIGLDSQLNLYVSDVGNHRVQKFMRY